MTPPPTTHAPMPMCGLSAAFNSPWSCCQQNPIRASDQGSTYDPRPLPTRRRPPQTGPRPAHGDMLLVPDRRPPCNSLFSGIQSHAHPQTLLRLQAESRRRIVQQVRCASTDPFVWVRDPPSKALHASSESATPVWLGTSLVALPSWQLRSLPRYLPGSLLAGPARRPQPFPDPTSGWKRLEPSGAWRALDFALPYLEIAVIWS